MYFFTKSKTSSYKVIIDMLNETKKTDDKTIKDLQNQLQKLDDRKDELDRNVSSLNKMIEMMTMQQEEDEKRFKEDKEEYETRLRQEKADVETLYKNKIDELTSFYSRMRNEDEERHKKESERLDSDFKNRLELIQSNLKSAYEEYLKHHAKELASSNTEQMNSILTPLKQEIVDMKTAMDNGREQNIKSTTSLETAIRGILERTQQLGTEADNLAKALRGDSKVQGNWGEMILSEILSSQGLIEGIHYDCQYTIRDEKGNIVKNEDSNKRMIPDVVIHFPDKKDAVIDSKVSLSAYIDYNNATTEAEKDMALSRHLDSIRNHYKELSRKNYQAYLKNSNASLDYVIMFVPIEGALQLALMKDGRLWREAFEHGVFITGEQNIIALLRMIQLAWTQYDQNQNQEQVFRKAQQLVDRVSDFLSCFNDIGNTIDKLKSTYSKSYEKLYSSNQSISKTASNLVKLGVKISSKKKNNLPIYEEAEDDEPSVQERNEAACKEQHKKIKHADQ